MIKLTGHLIGSCEWEEWDNYEKYIFGDGLIPEKYNAYADTPSKTRV